jgi:c(7)-type cytochrome triheme protein
MEGSGLRLGSVPGAVLLVAVFAVSRAATEPTPELRLPPDVTYNKAETSPGPVVFSHATHVPLAGNKCVACHPTSFSILQPTSRITHNEMQTGKKCGTCHNGTKASGIQGDCAHCHQLEGGS